MQRELTPTEKRFADSIIGIKAACSIIITYYYNAIKGVKFRNPKIADKAEKIKKFAESISNKELDGIIVMKNPDIFEDEHALHLWRIFDHFLFMNTDKLEYFADHLESLEKEQSDETTD